MRTWRSLSYYAFNAGLLFQLAFLPTSLSITGTSCYAVENAAPNSTLSCVSTGSSRVTECKDGFEKLDTGRSDICQEKKCGTFAFGTGVNASHYIIYTAQPTITNATCYALSHTRHLYGARPRIFAPHNDSGWALRCAAIYPSGLSK